MPAAHLSRASAALRTLTIAGNLVLNAGSNYEVSVTNVAQRLQRGRPYRYGRGKPHAGILSVTAVAATATIRNSTPYTVLTANASSGVSGTFSGLTIATGSNFGD